MTQPSAPTAAAPPPPNYPPPPTYPPPVSSGPKMPPWLDLGVLITGVGALLVFIGFLFGSAAVSQTNVSFNTYQGDLEAFFTVTGFGILLIVGGWLYRTVMIARRGRP